MKKFGIVILLFCLIFTASSCSCRINITSDTTETEAETEEDRKAEDTEEGEGSGNLIGYTEGLYDGNPPVRPSGGAAPAQTVPAPSIPTISFPYTIPGTSLVIRQISSYSGYFIEDASDREVSGIAAIVLTNNGGDLDFAGIGISQGERNLAFSGSQIPAGATVIIQEQTGAAFSNDPYYSATATVTPAVLDRAEEYVKTEDNGDGTFFVINISEKTLPEVKVFFKNYLPEEDVYVGGITYSITLNDLEPDTAVEVTASHYDVRYTRFVKISITQGNE